MKKEPWAVHPFVGLGTVPHTAEEQFLIENILGTLCEWCSSSLSGSVLPGESESQQTLLVSQRLHFLFAVRVPCTP